MLKAFKSFSKFKRRLLAGLIVIIIAITVLLTANTFILHKQHYYFGTITSTADNHLTITTKFNNERVVVLSDGTKILGGPHTNATALEIGQRVMVVSFENKNDEREAKLIRLFK